MPRTQSVRTLHYSVLALQSVQACHVIRPSTLTIMLHPRRALWTFAALTLLAVMERNAMTAAVADRDDKGKKPSVSLKVTPPLAIAPAKVRAAVEIRGRDHRDEFALREHVHAVSAHARHVEAPLA